MPSTVIAGVDVVSIPGLTIKEFHGGVSTKDSTLSAVHETITVEPGSGSSSTNNPWRCPEFTEYILMIRGEAHVEYGDGEKATIVVAAGSGIYLPKGCRVRVNYPGAAEHIAICLPAFSPDTEHPEPPEGATPTTLAHRIQNYLDLSPTLFTSVDVVKAPTLTITEYFGNVASQDPTFSACISKVDEPCSEAWQRPTFAEWVLVLSGVLHLEHEGENGTETTVVPAGSGVFLAADERVKWVWPEACTYVPICVPAFTPDGCRREPEEGSAKDADPETMAELHKLHEEAHS
mmetsp:Transcript_23403/g.28755  ORF Transcript_23403/g.28755 Transcript_23403/m.28755 type:complete len:290 (-) Transcript_23403:290-1159(-)